MNPLSPALAQGLCRARTRRVVTFSFQTHFPNCFPENAKDMQIWDLAEICGEWSQVLAFWAV